MITFIWPWVFLLLPLPFIVRRLAPVARVNTGYALKVPFYNRLERLERELPRHGCWHTRLIWPFVIWVLVISALAQPVWIRDDQPVPVSGRDLMLLIDVSGSMREMDFMQDGEPADRLSVVKRMASDFVSGRLGDRVGVILFGDKPFLRAPLSHDHETVKQLIAESEIALAGESTAIGDAIGLAIKRMRNLDSESRVIVLLTDGANNEGNLPPRQAAEVASTFGVRIYTIGVGSADEPAPNPYGKWSAEGAQRFEQSVLRSVSEITEGFYFHVLDSEGLQAAYDRLDELEPSLGEDLYKYLGESLYHWPLGLALLISLLVAGWHWYSERQRGVAHG